MHQGEGKLSAVQEVDALIRKLKVEKRLPTGRELTEARPSLLELRARLERIRAKGPEFAGTDLSDEVWALVKLCEQPELSFWSASLRRRIAAIFL
ncbi:MAG TPA: hypothetical protein VJU16_09240 [Planctomycetota bacterium]|nr:hypothetical protein [Planctomycetota bacterium]